MRTILHILRSQNHRSADFPKPVRKKKERNSTNCCELCFLQTEKNSSQQFDEFFSFLLRTILQILRAQKHRSADFPDPGISVTGPSQGMKIRGGS